MNIIFDMDGVILNSEPLHAEAHLRVLRSFGIFEDVDSTSYIGISGRIFWEDMIRRFGLTEPVAALEKRKVLAIISLLKELDMPPSAGLLELLDDLRQLPARLAVASSSERLLVDAVLAHFAIRSRFDVVIDGDRTARHKPDPDLYLLALRDLGADAADTVAVEDSAAGVQAALAAGLPCIGYRNPTSGDQDLSAAGWIVDQLGQISAIARQLAGR